MLHLPSNQNTVPRPFITRDKKHLPCKMVLTSWIFRQNFYLFIELQKRILETFAPSSTLTPKNNSMMPAKTLLIWLKTYISKDYNRLMIAMSFALRLFLPQNGLCPLLSGFYRKTQGSSHPTFASFAIIEFYRLQSPLQL